MNNKLPIISFPNVTELRQWLECNHLTSQGFYVRIFKKDSGQESVTFEEVLDEGLCFGWSESMRLSGDKKSYLQKFTPRRSKGTTSERNRQHIDKLIKQGRMTAAGLSALNL